ncbi:hypothetical protein ALP29_200407 [Pseudomonas syringae pv. avii]|uniref:Uncharacterized protein n=1 Tax=Pseudomonas syringae pv. avii TaxID=663959 RepID=A0A3M5V0I5_PSESX|nr:hypothetical protein ALP29_200407 [Pseudomonas syringae pv. avii]
MRRQPTNLEVFYDDIGLRRQLPDQLLPFRSREVDGDRLLVTIGRQVISRLTGVMPGRILKKRRPPGASVIATARTLDLDDVSAQISKDLPGPGSGQNTRKIEHSYM